MIDFGLNLLAVIGLYVGIERCLYGRTADELEGASLIPFADDPDVARRVEQATGKNIDTVEGRIPM